MFGDALITARLRDLFQGYAGLPPDQIAPLPRSGSHRQYFRIRSGDSTCIAVYTPDAHESEAFLHFTRHFRQKGLPVPALLASQTDQQVYLLEDLGDISLKDRVDQSREDDSFPGSVLPLYQEALEILVRFQVEAGEGLDYTRCVPRAAFDEESMLWDLNHFKYLFLKITGIPFDEQELENDFRSLAAFLSEAPADFFLYRDFQSRNIMHDPNGALRFIDYQGGRRGALQYDVASLLFEAKTDLPHGSREALLDHYLSSLKRIQGIERRAFMKYYHGFVLIRILQAMGAYGLRGIVEHKPLFLQSIPYALKNIRYLLDQRGFTDRWPALKYTLEWLSDNKDWSVTDSSGEMTVQIRSFSYKNGIPEDYSGHGGGFVFDCRVLPNPGREAHFTTLTGKDQEVIRYLDERNEVLNFLDHVWAITRSAVKTYRARGFTHLMLSFGCTGGRHRSVYCAEKITEKIQEELKARVNLVHRDMPA